MRLNAVLGIVFACIIAAQAQFPSIYIDPKEVAAGTLDCASNCPLQAPCGPPSLISITTECYVYIGNGDWQDTLYAAAAGVVHPVFRQWDSAGTGDYIRNLRFYFTGDANVQLRLEFWNATGTVVNVTSNNLAISNSAFILDDLEPFNFVFKGTYPILDMQYTNLCKNSGALEPISLQGPSTQQMDIRISDCTIEIPDVGIFLGHARGVTITGSFLKAYSLITGALTFMDISNSHLLGFAGSLSSIPVPRFSSTSSTFTGLSRDFSLFLFGSSASMSRFTATDSNFTWVQFPSVQLPNMVAIRNTFHDGRFSIELLSPNVPIPFHIENNTFVRYNPSYPALDLNPITLQRDMRATNFNSVYLSGNRFENRYGQASNDKCSVSLGDLLVTNTSSLVADRLCVANTQFDGSLETSYINIAIGGLGYINTTGDTALSSFTSDVKIAFSKNHLSYSITNASQGIDALIEEMPLSLHLSWQDSNHRLAVGDTWPVFTKVNLDAAIPTILSTDGSFTFNLSSSCSTIPSICMVNFTILSFNCPCNPQHSLPCGNPFVPPCTCIAPWTGPTCDISSSSPTSNPTSNPSSQSCSTPQPSPEFICQHGTWSSNTSITQDTLNIPSNSGTIVVNGNLTITHTVIFQGLGSLINVTGCIFVDGDVVVELTDHDIEEIRKGSKTFILMSSVDGNDCESSNDLSLIQINVKTPDKCVKVDAVNSGTKQSLAATFTISESKCSSSHLVAIIVPSVVGGVIILSAVAVIVILKIRHDKMHR